MEIIYTQNSRELAQAVAEKISFAAYPSGVRYFNNKEMSVRLHKFFREAFVIASTETNEDWIELFLLLDALKYTSRVILCMPYMGYARQDKQNVNESYAAGMFAKFIEVMPVSQCIIIDNHSEPLLRIPTYHISSNSVFTKDIIAKYGFMCSQQKCDNNVNVNEKRQLSPTISNQITVVSPDKGGIEKAYEISKVLGCEFVICNKEKTVFNELKRIDPMGNIKDKICIIVDDMVDSGKTLQHTAESLKKAGSKDIIAYCTHGVLSSGSVERLENTAITEIILTDSICKNVKLSPKFRKLSIDSLIVDAIRCIL